MAIGGGDVTSTENILSGEYEDPATHEKRSGQILWIRGLTRLQTQVILLYKIELGSVGFAYIGFFIYICVRVYVFLFFLSQFAYWVDVSFSAS